LLFEHDLFRPGCARRSVARKRNTTARLRAGGKLVSDRRSRAGFFGIMLGMEMASGGLEADGDGT
jgi:hypothetical protein